MQSSKGCHLAEVDSLTLCLITRRSTAAGFNSPMCFPGAVLVPAQCLLRSHLLSLSVVSAMGGLISQTSAKLQCVLVSNAKALNCVSKSSKWCCDCCNLFASCIRIFDLWSRCRDSRNPSEWCPRQSRPNFNRR